MFVCVYMYTYVHTYIYIAKSDVIVMYMYIQGWGNYPGKSGHDLTNIFDTGLVKLASYMFYYDNKNNTGLTNKMLLLPALTLSLIIH